ncbi:hypothetical protein BDAP_000445 [Binucleata daphniae]
MYFFILQLSFLIIKATNTAKEYKLFLNEELGITEENFNQEIYEEILESLSLSYLKGKMLQTFDTWIIANCDNNITSITDKIQILENYNKETAEDKKCIVDFLKKTKHIIKCRNNSILALTYNIVARIHNAIKESITSEQATNEECVSTTSKQSGKYDNEILNHKVVKNLIKYRNLYLEFKGALDTLQNDMQENSYMNIDDLTKIFNSCLISYKDNLTAFKENYEENTKDTVQVHKGVDEGKFTAISTNKNDNITQALQIQTNLGMINNDNHLNISNNNIITIINNEEMRNIYTNNYIEVLLNYEKYLQGIENSISYKKIEDVLPHMEHNKNLEEKNSELITDFNTYANYFIGKLEFTPLKDLIYQTYHELNDAIQKLNVANKHEIINTVAIEYDTIINGITNIIETKMTPIINAIRNVNLAPLQTKMQMLEEIKIYVLKIIEIGRYDINEHIEHIKIINSIKYEAKNDENTSNPDVTNYTIA